MRCWTLLVCQDRYGEKQHSRHVIYSIKQSHVRYHRVEAFYDDLKESLSFVIRCFPYHRRTIRPQIHMNYSLQIEDKLATPDLIISLTPTQGPTEVVLIPYIGETALTEEWDHIFEKMESMIATHPEAILASIVLV